MLNTQQMLETFEEQFERWSTTDDPEVIAAALKFSFTTMMMISANNDPIDNSIQQALLMRKFEGLFESTGEEYRDAVNKAF